MMPIDGSGFIRGDYFAPAASGLTKVRLVTLGGDGATDAVLGHVTALAYRRSDPTALCPDVPERAMSGCALEAGFSGESFVRTSAPLTTIEEWLADRAWLPYNSPLGYGIVRRVYLYDNTQNLARHYLDTNNTFSGNPTLAGVYDSAFSGTLGAGTGGFFDINAVGAGDLTLKIVFKVPSDFDVTSTPDYDWIGGTGLALLELYSTGTVSNSWINALVSIHQGRLKLFHVVRFGVLIEVDLGPSTIAATDEWMQLLWRAEVISSTEMRMSLYLDTACPTAPTLLYQTIIAAYTGPILGVSDVYTMDWNFFNYQIVVSPRTIHTAQVGATYTAEDYGL